MRHQTRDIRHETSDTRHQTRGMRLTNICASEFLCTNKHSNTHTHRLKEEDILSFLSKLIVNMHIQPTQTHKYTHTYRLEEVDNLSFLRNLQSLDVSFNKIDLLQPSLPPSLLFLSTRGNPFKRMVNVPTPIQSMAVCMVSCFRR